MKPKILVGYDFSAASERALVWAGDLCRSVGGGSIQMVHVVSSMPSAAAMMAPVPVLPTEMDLRELEGALLAAADRLRVDATPLVVVAPALGPTIVHEADRQSADLVVMGTHGRGIVARAFLGSVADHVVRNASCPVVVMRAAETAAVKK